MMLKVSGISIVLVLTMVAPVSSQALFEKIPSNQVALVSPFRNLLFSPIVSAGFQAKPQLSLPEIKPVNLSREFLTYQACEKSS